MAAAVALGGIAFLNAIVPGAAYVVAAERVRGAGGAWPGRRTAVFLAALLVLAAATSGAADERARASLAWHMAQQMTLLFIVPLGLVAGRPDELVRRLCGWSLRAIGPVALGTVWAGFVGVQWLVHIPAVLDVTLDQPAARAGAHWGLVAAGVAFFGCALSAASPGRFHPLAVGLYVVSMMPMTDALGLWLMFDPHVIYTSYAGPGAIGDQQRAGAVMFAAGTVPLLVAAGVTYAWASGHRVRAAG